MNRNSTRQVLNNIVWLMLDKAFMLVISLVVLFVVANYYGPTEYGNYQYAVNVVLILEVVVQLVDARIVKQKYEKVDFDEVVYNVTIAKVLLSMLTLLFGIVISIFKKTQDNVFTLIMWILLVDNIVKNLYFGMSNRFEFDLKSKRNVIASNFGLTVGTILQLLAVFLKLSIVYIALIQMLTSLAVLLVVRRQYMNEYHPVMKKRRINWELLKEILKESFPLAIALAASTIYTRCDSVMIGSLLSTKEVGIYSISTKLISTMQVFLVPIQSSIFVKLLEWKSDKYIYEINYLRITSIVTWLAIFASMLSFLVIPLIFQILKPDYLPAFETYRILVIGTIFSYNAILRSSHLTVTGNGKILLIAQVVTLVVNIGLNYVFINTYGMNGAALATVMAQCISLFLSNLFFKETRFVFKCQLRAFNPIHILK